MRDLLPYGYIAYNGVRLPDSIVESYNDMQRNINAFILAGMPVPENLLNGSHNILFSAIENLSKESRNG